MPYTASSTTVTNLAVTGKNTSETKATSPAWFNADPGMMLDTTIYGTNLTVKIFGSPSLSAGLPIKEKPAGSTNWYPINQVTQTDGTNVFYIDPVNNIPSYTEVVSTTARVQSWSNAPAIPMPAQGIVTSQTNSIMVGTTILGNQIKRKVTTMPSPPGAASTNATVTIENIP